MDLSDFDKTDAQMVGANHPITAALLEYVQFHKLKNYKNASMKENKWTDSRFICNWHHLTENTCIATKREMESSEQQNGFQPVVHFCNGYTVLGNSGVLYIFEVGILYCALECYISYVQYMSRAF